MDVWVADLDRGSMTRVTLGAAADSVPIWSPDAENRKRHAWLNAYVLAALLRLSVQSDAAATLVHQNVDARAEGLYRVPYSLSPASPSPGTM